MRRAPWWLCLLVLLFGVVSGAAAQSVPPALQGWQAWVQGEAQLRAALQYEQHLDALKEAEGDLVTPYSPSARR